MEINLQTLVHQVATRLTQKGILVVTHELELLLGPKW